MSLSKEEKKKKEAVIKSFWQDELKTTDFVGAHVIPKFCYTSSVSGELVITLFESELSKPFYCELINNEWEPPTTGVREVHLLHYSEKATEKFQKNAGPMVTTFNVPISDLTKIITFNELDKLEEVPQQEMVFGKLIENPKISSQKSQPKEISDPPPTPPLPDWLKAEEDAHYSTMSIKDVFAILHLKPVSNKNWLNNLIINNRQS